MGNCQAIDAATLVQHPCGKVDKFYWPVIASEVMKMNPGHYVALLLTTTTTAAAAAATTSCQSDGNNNHSINKNTVRFTRIKLLRPTETLVLGQVYRLIATQEVMKCLSAKKHAKMRKKQSEEAGKTGRVKEEPGLGIETVGRRSEVEKTNQVTKHEIHRQRTATAKSKIWQPSLQSISEAAS